MLKGMQICKIIRKKLGLNPWVMAQKMGKSIQAYQYLERSGRNVSLKDLNTLYSIAREKYSLEEFWGLVEKEAKKK